jgi:hypothetical protein
MIVGADGLCLAVGRRPRSPSDRPLAHPGSYDPNVTANDDHGSLPAYALRLVSHLDAQRGVSTLGHVDHMQHREHAKRARQLGDHLHAVLQLLRTHHYTSALVLTRAALEHHVLDRLILLANYYVETFTGVRKKDVPAESARIATLKATTRPDIARWWWDDQGMHIVVRGLHSTRSRKGRGQIVSYWYFNADQFDPFTGGRKHAGKLASPFWERSHRQAWGRRVGRSVATMVQVRQAG